MQHLQTLIDQQAGRSDLLESTQMIFGRPSVRRRPCLVHLSRHRHTRPHINFRQRRTALQFPGGKNPVFLVHRAEQILIHRLRQAQEQEGPVLASITKHAHRPFLQLLVEIDEQVAA